MGPLKFCVVFLPFREVSNLDFKNVFLKFKVRKRLFTPMENVNHKNFNNMPYVCFYEDF